MPNVENKTPSTDAFVKKIEHAIDIKKIQNKNVTTAALDSRLNDLKNQHIADEVKKINDKTKKKSSDILSFESR